MSVFIFSSQLVPRNRLTTQKKYTHDEKMSHLQNSRFLKSHNLWGLKILVGPNCSLHQDKKHDRQSAPVKNSMTSFNKVCFCKHSNQSRQRFLGSRRAPKQMQTVARHPRACCTSKKPLTQGPYVTDKVRGHPKVKGPRQQEDAVDQLSESHALGARRSIVAETAIQPLEKMLTSAIQREFGMSGEGDGRFVSTGHKNLSEVLDSPYYVVRHSNQTPLWYWRRRNS